MLLNLDNTEVAADALVSGIGNRPRWLAATSGLSAAIVVSYLTCNPPQAHMLSLRTRLLTSAIYILIACLAGTLGTWLALSRESRRRRLLLCGIRGWVFLPAMMMFLREGSVWASFVAVMSAALMAESWSRSTGTMAHRSPEEPRQDVEKNIFITQLRIKPISWDSFAVSLCLYGAFLSAVEAKLAFLTLLLGTAAFLLVSQITTRLSKTEHKELWCAVAFCCAFVALSASSGTSDLVWKLRSFHVLEHSLAKPQSAKQKSEERSSEGYRAVVLWPIQKKEKVLPSPPSSTHPSTPRSAKPWVIPFYGPYWYFKTPGESPGPRARIAHGDPLKVNVHSTNSAPLLMEAHQNLPIPIDLVCCREIQVVLKNDVSLGASDVGILLTDSHAKGKPSQNLGIKYVASDSVVQTPGNTSPLEETVSFPIRKSGKFRKFDQITVVLVPGAQHSTAGRKVAVERFIMIPN